MHGHDGHLATSQCSGSSFETLLPLIREDRVHQREQELVRWRGEPRFSQLEHEWANPREVDLRQLSTRAAQ